MFEYKVVWFFDTDLKTDHGLISGSSYKDAVEKLLVYYGEEEVAALELTWVSSENLVVYNEDITSIKGFLEEV